MLCQSRTISGRWQPGQVTEAYVRSTIAIVLKAQAQIAERVRAGGVDFLGEASELSKFARYLRLSTSSASTCLLVAGQFSRGRPPGPVWRGPKHPF